MLKKKKGILYGVGVGPGNPELMTLQALRCIKESDVIVLPSEPKEECYAYQIVKQVYPNLDEKEIVCLPFLMIKDKAVLQKKHNEIYERISSYLNRNKTVAFLTIGDSCIYSTYSYMHSRAVAEGREAYYINGIPSFCAAAARLGISLGENQEEIHIVPASYGIEESVKWSGTKIYMKSGKKLKQLKESLREQEGLKVYTISNCGLPNEKVGMGIDEIAEDSGYLTLVIAMQDKRK